MTQIIDMTEFIIEHFGTYRDIEHETFFHYFDESAHRVSCFKSDFEFFKNKIPSVIATPVSFDNDELKKYGLVGNQPDPFIIEVEITAELLWARFLKKKKGLG